MGVRLRVKFLAPLRLALATTLALSVAGPALAPAFAADPVPNDEFPVLSKEECTRFFGQILKHTDKDLALIPFAVQSLTGIYAVLHAQPAGARTLVDAIYAADIRRMAYRLRALASSMKSVDEAAFKALGTEFKVLEKAIGDAVFETEMVHILVTDPTLREHVTPAMEAVFLGRLQATEDRLLQNLRRFGWTGDKKKNAYWYVLHTIETKAPITKNSFLKKKVVELQAKELRKIHERIASGELNPREIEDGVHELRRQIREVLLTFTTYQGMFHLDESIRFAGVPARKIGPMRWLVPIDVELMKKPVALPNDAYLTMVQAVKDLGEMKATDGIKEFLAAALRDLPVGRGSPKNRAVLRAELAELHRVVSASEVSVASLEKTRQAATAYFAELVRSGVLLQFSEYLEKVAKRL